MIITAFNPDTDDLEKTYVSTYTAEGATVIPVKDNDRFVVGQPVLLGSMGDERTEIGYLNAVAADKESVTLNSATKFGHSSDEPVYLLQYDEVNFYRMNSANGTPVLIHTEPIDVDNAEKITRWDDPNTLNSHYYQTSFSNSITDDESELSDAVSATGMPTTSAGTIIDQVVRRVRDQSYNVLTVDEYIDIMNEVGSDLITQAHRPYRFLKREITINTVANQGWVPLPDDLWKFNKVRVATTSGNYQRFDPVYPLAKEAFEARYDNNQSTPQDNVFDVAIDEENNRLLIHPVPRTSQTGVIKLQYYKTFDKIESVGDVIETPNILIYRYKLMAEFYSAKSETDNQWAALATKYESKYGNEIVKMQRVNRLDTGTPRSMAPRRMYRERRYHL